MLKNVEKGKPFTLPKIEIEAIDCDFFPFVNVIKDRDELTVINMDPIEHDIQGYETARERGARVLFNRPLPMNPFHRVVQLLGENMHIHRHLPHRGSRPHTARLRYSPPRGLRRHPTRSCGD